MDANHFRGASGVSTSKNAVCIFETNYQLPLRRHYDKDFEGSYKFYAGVPNHGLVIRSISSVSNYDYVFDFKLFTDGSFKTDAGM